jgi:sugar phosphate isomerase/epimerase
MDAVSHVHYCDSDGKTSEFHFPPGRGILDLQTILGRFRGRKVTTAWDLYGWPAPRFAMRKYLDRYQEFVAALGTGK